MSTRSLTAVPQTAPSSVEPLTLTAADLLPLLRKLPPAEQKNLALLAWEASVCSRTDGEAYAAAPPTEEEFGIIGQDPMAWEGEGWESFYAPR